MMLCLKFCLNRAACLEGLSEHICFLMVKLFCSSVLVKFSVEGLHQLPQAFSDDGLCVVLKLLLS